MTATEIADRPNTDETDAVGTAQPAVNAAVAKSSTRLAFADGLRGIAIFMVLMRHFYLAIYRPGLPRWLDILSFGYLGVHLFLILSGFCVAWAFVGPRPTEMNLSQFAFRRATRILPAYYSALAVFLILYPIPSSTLARQLATHVTMTHNLFPDTTLAINGVFWSLALEFQLYVTFPILLTLYRKSGLLAMTLGAFGVELAYRLVVARHLGTQGALAETVPWSVFGRVFEFALGVCASAMVAASLKKPFAASFRRALPLLAIAAAIVGILAKRRLGITSPITDLAWSAAFFLLLLSGAAAGSLSERLFTWRPLVALGVISYSVYLMHNLVLGHVATALSTRLPLPILLTLGLAITVALSIAVSYLFYRLVEKPSIDYFTRRRRAAAAPPSPLS